MYSGFAVQPCLLSLLSEPGQNQRVDWKLSTRTTSASHTPLSKQFPSSLPFPIFHSLFLTSYGNFLVLLPTRLFRCISRCRIFGFHEAALFSQLFPQHPACRGETSPCPPRTLHCLGSVSTSQRRGLWTRGATQPAPPHRWEKQPFCGAQDSLRVFSPNPVFLRKRTLHL